MWEWCCKCAKWLTMEDIIYFIFFNVLWIKITR